MLIWAVACCVPASRNSALFFPLFLMKYGMALLFTPARQEDSTLLASVGEVTVQVRSGAVGSAGMCPFTSVL